MYSTTVRTDRAALLHEFGIAEVGETKFRIAACPTWDVPELFKQRCI